MIFPRSHGGRIAILLVSFAFLILVGAGIASIVEYKPYGVPDSRREEYDEKLAEIERQKLLRAEAQAKKLGKAVVEHVEHDFGFLDPQTTHAEHGFRIENHGQGDLLVEPAGSSCKCTVAKLANPVIPPGEYAIVTVVWNVGSELSEDFEQTALVRTNDAEKPEITLTVRGKVASEWAVTDPIAASSIVAIGQPATGSTLLYSQTTEHLVVLETESSSSEITVTTEPVKDHSLAALHAKSAYKLVATYKPTDKRTSFNEVVKVHVLDPDTGKDAWIDVTFQGKFHKPVRFYGPEIWKTSGLSIETVEVGSKKTWAFFARFHVDHEVQEAVIVDVKPDGLIASIEPMKRSKNTFRVEVRIADDAKPVVFDFKEQGYVEVADKNDPELSNWLPLHGRIIAKVGN